MTDRATDPDLKLTRRTALGALAGVGAASLLRPASGSAAAAQPSIFSQPIGSLNGRSGAIAAPRQFELVGVEWESPPRPQVELRVRPRNGPWSRWTNASVLGHGPDKPARLSPLIGDPVWTGPAQYVELESSEPLSGVRLHYVSVDVGPESLRRAQLSSLPLAQPVLDAGPGQPPIIARKVWAHSHRPSVPPSYGTIKLAFVHHTDNPNGYTAAEVPAMLFAIYQFHRFVRGWNDIGYNFVIDLFGRIWEAREGGIDEAVVGAQAGGYNLESTGVAILGTFMSVLPSKAALTALERLLAWKLSLHGVPTEGQVTVVVDPADYFYTPFRPGQHVSLPRVAGHRQGDTTDCPGNVLFDYLPNVRPRVAALARNPLLLTLSAPSTATSGQAALSGSLRDLAGQPISGAPVEIQRIGKTGSEQTLQTATTDPNGLWSATLPVTQNVRVRALHRPAPAAVSDSAQITLHQRSGSR